MSAAISEDGDEPQSRALAEERYIADLEFEHADKARPLAAPLPGVIERLMRVARHPAHKKCESPLEQLAVAHLIAVLPSTTKIDAQVKIGRYRADIVLNDKVVVECDGHEFHSTDDQRRYDAERDRYMEARGYVVYRVEGWWLHRNPGEALSSAVAAARAAQ